MNQFYYNICRKIPIASVLLNNVGCTTTITTAWSKRYTHSTLQTVVEAQRPRRPTAAAKRQGTSSLQQSSHCIYSSALKNDATKDKNNSKMTSTADFDKKYDIVDSPTPRHTLMSGRYKQGFAYFTMRNRLPVTLTNIIDSLTKDKDELSAKYGEASREEIKNVVGMLSKLKYELQTDKPLQPFTGAEPDLELWNTFLEQLGPDANSFFKACWLYAECYMYRRVSSFFESTTHLKGHDYFAKQKTNALQISVDAMETVALAIRNLERNEATFCKILKLNLWGNRCDLSITSGQEVKPNANPFDAIADLDASILIDSTASVWRCLDATPKKSNIVDIICDNAGYELFTDFIIADYMIEHQLAKTVRFHVKAIPWFISDVTPRDFHETLQYLSRHKSVPLADLGKKWRRYVEENVFVLQPVEYFWTSPYEFHRMSDINNDLYKRLGEARLAIFKGDLNYRKLIGDFTWDTTEDFLICLRGFQPTSLCTLRTVKADLICGLLAGQAEELFRVQSDWMTTGAYGVIQYAEASQCGCVN